MLHCRKKSFLYLMKLFPNIQFVLTTHSPFILNSTPNAVVYDLESHTLVKEGLTQLPYEGIVEGYFKADCLSQELREKFEEYKKIVQKQLYTENLIFLNHLYIAFHIILLDNLEQSYHHRQ